MFRVKRFFDSLVVVAGAWGEDFANPIGDDFDGFVFRRFAHPFAAPAGEIGRDFWRAGQFDPGLDEDPPTAGATDALVVGAEDTVLKERRGSCVPKPRSWLCVENAVEDLSFHSGRESEQICVGRELLRGVSHRDRECLTSSEFASPGRRRLSRSGHINLLA